MTIYVFYNNDPIGDDQGGGVDHLRAIYRLLEKSNLNFKIIGSKKPDNSRNFPCINVEYISTGTNILRFFILLFWWFLKNRRNFTDEDVFHFHRNYIAWPKFLISPRKGSVIITYHTYTGEILKEWLPSTVAAMARKIMLIAERKAASLADKLIFVAERVRSDLLNGPLEGVNTSNTVIPAFHEEELFRSAKIADTRLSHKLLCVGRLSAVKNFNLAIDILERLNAKDQAYSLTIVGDGEQRQEIEQRIAKSSCRNQIMLKGLIPHAEMPVVYQNHGILLVTSKTETGPTVVKEALACNRLVVTTDVGDVNEWIENGENGYVCPSQAEALSNALLNASKMIQLSQFKQSVRFEEKSETRVMKDLLIVYSAYSSGRH